MLHVLVVDDEAPALEEQAYLLRRDPRVLDVTTAASGAEALRALEKGGFDVVFLDIRMPGIDGLDVGRLIARFAHPPDIVFVTAFDDFALEAFELEATDYVLKPVRAERLAEAVRRVAERRRPPGSPPDLPDETIAVELGGLVEYVNRSDVVWVEAQGDYARLHTAGRTHLIRVSLTELEERWREAGFMRIHRSHLVSLRHVEQVRLDGGRWTVQLAGQVLTVSRRHAPELRDVMVHRARPADPRPVR
jgi:two-component system, LytTR family, response regulator LytT